MRRMGHPPVAVWATTLTIGLGLLVTTALDPTPDDSGPTSPVAGPTTRVAVARRSLDIGRVIAETDVDWRSVPQGVVSEQAIRDDAGAGTGADQLSRSGPVGRIVAAAIEAGEPIVESRLAPNGLRGVAARTPAGFDAIAVPVDTRTPPLEIGQRVDLFAMPGSGALDRGLPLDRDVRSERVARDGVVLDVDEHRATIAVPDESVASAAAASIDGTVIVVVTGPTGRTMPSP